MGYNQNKNIERTTIIEKGNFMKKKKALFMLLIMCISLSFSACGKTEKNENNEKYEKYDTLIDFMENGDYEQASEEFSRLVEDGKKENSSENSSQENEEEIEITMDNWQDYFEIRPCVSFHKNDFDEVDSIGMANGFGLKKEFEERIIDANVAVEYTQSDVTGYPFEFNMETKEKIIGEPYTEEESQNKGIIFYNDRGDGTLTFEYNEGMEKSFIKSFISFDSANKEKFKIEGSIIKWDGALFSKADITRIQGTITLVGK